MRFYYDNKFNFLGFSYSLSAFGMFAGVAYIIGAILCITLFMPIYPIWYFLAMKNWDKLVYENPNDLLLRGSIKPRVFDMTRFEWKMLLGVWVLGAIALPLHFASEAKKENMQRETDRIIKKEREQKQREDSIPHIQWLKEGLPESYIKRNYRTSTSGSRQYDKTLEYYDEHFDDYHDDPEDGITYPDEVFDFYDD